MPDDDRLLLLLLVVDETVAEDDVVETEDVSELLEPKLLLVKADPLKLLGNVTVELPVLLLLEK